MALVKSLAIPMEFGSVKAKVRELLRNLHQDRRLLVAEILMDLLQGFS